MGNWTNTTQRNMGRRRPRGAAMVELALILPLLLMLLLGVIEFGWLFLKSNQVANAARQACRVAVRPNVTVEAVETVVEEAMTTAGLGDKYNEPPDVSDVDVAYGEPVTVTITVPYDNVSLLGLFWIDVLPDNIRGSATMAKEGK